MKPTVVDTVPSLGAKRRAHENNVPGIKPPTAENITTHAKRSEVDKPSPCHTAYAPNEPKLMQAKPISSKRCADQFKPAMTQDG
jgi:hypothetical protein